MAIVLKRPSAFMASPRDCNHLQLSPRDHLHHLVCRIVINNLCDTHPSTPEEPYHIWYSCASMVNKTTMVHTACASPRPWVSTCLPASEIDPSHLSSLTGQFCGHQPLLQTLHETNVRICKVLQYLLWMLCNPNFWSAIYVCCSYTIFSLSLYTSTEGKLNYIYWYI